MKLTVNADGCVGCGLCVGSYPQTFEFDAEGKAHVISEITPEEGQEAIANCPAGAISE